MSLISRFPIYKRIHVSLLFHLEIPKPTRLSGRYGGYGILLIWAISGPEKIGNGCPHPHGMGASIPTYNKAYDKDGKQFLQQGTMSSLSYTRPKPYECLLQATPYLYIVHASYLCVLCFCSLQNPFCFRKHRASVASRTIDFGFLCFSTLFFQYFLYVYITTFQISMLYRDICTILLRVPSIIIIVQYSLWLHLYLIAPNLPVAN